MKFIEKIKHNLNLFRQHFAMTETINGKPVNVDIVVYTHRSDYYATFYEVADIGKGNQPVGEEHHVTGYFDTVDEVLDAAIEAVILHYQPNFPFGENAKAAA
jgi:hypothetical protein